MVVCAAAHRSEDYRYCASRWKGKGERGDVDIGIGVPSFGLPLLCKGEWGSAINFYEYTYPYKRDIVVKPGSPIKELRRPKRQEDRRVGFHQAARRARREGR